MAAITDGDLRLSARITERDKYDQEISACPEIMDRGLFDKNELHNLFHLTSTEQVLALIKKFHDDRGKMEHVCINYDKYRVELS